MGMNGGLRLRVLKKVHGVLIAITKENNVDNNNFCLKIIKD